MGQPKVKRWGNGHYRDNGDGTTSTHRMSYGEADGVYYAFPTLFPNPMSKQSSTSPQSWIEPSDPFSFAKNAGELYEFKTEKEAADFAAGGYKMMQPKKYLNGGNIAAGAMTGALSGTIAGSAVPGIGNLLGGFLGGAVGAGTALIQEVNAENAAKKQNVPMYTPTVASTGHVFAMGGNIMNQYSEIEAGGTHEQNPNGGVPVSNKALLEEGEVKVGNKVFSNRLINPKTGKSFADEAKSYVDKKRPNDAIANTYSQKMLDGLFNEQEALKVATQPQPEQGAPQVMANGGIFGAGLNTGIQGSQYSSIPDYTGGMDPLNKPIISPLMYAPVASAAIGLGTTLLSKPEKKDLNMFNNNDTLKYNPVDFSQVKRDINSSYSSAGTMLPNATRGNAGSYLANLQGMATSRGRNIGSASLQAEIANTQNEVQTDTYNSQLAGQNQSNRMQVANMNDADRAAYKSALLDSISNLGNNVGMVGRQATNANIANNLSEYTIDGNYKRNVAFQKALAANPNLTREQFDAGYIPDPQDLVPRNNRNTYIPSTVVGGTNNTQPGVQGTTIPTARTVPLIEENIPDGRLIPPSEGLIYADPGTTPQTTTPVAQTPVATPQQAAPIINGGLGASKNYIPPISGKHNSPEDSPYNNEAYSTGLSNIEGSKDLASLEEVYSRAQFKAMQAEKSGFSQSNALMNLHEAYNKKKQELEKGSATITAQTVPNTVVPNSLDNSLLRTPKQEEKRLRSLEKQALRSEKENARIAEKEADLKQREELAVTKEEKSKLREERRALRNNKEVAKTPEQLKQEERRKQIDRQNLEEEQTRIERLNNIMTTGKTKEWIDGEEVERTTYVNSTDTEETIQQKRRQLLDDMKSGKIVNYSGTTWSNLPTEMQKRIEDMFLDGALDTNYIKYLDKEEWSYLDDLFRSDRRARDTVGDIAEWYTWNENKNKK